jgi:RimJ/RimL family protein N-acetyltransferase
MQLKRLDSPELIQLAASWLARKENHQWLDFGDGRQTLTPEWLKIMSQRDTHLLRIYTSDDDQPIGLAGLDTVNRSFKTGRFWFVTGEHAFRGRGYATRAASTLLTIAFRDFGLQAVNSWAVDTNPPNPSVRIAEQLNFRLIGRQRQCHYIDGRAYDRLWFDLLASEHKELSDDRTAHARTADCGLVSREAQR